MSLTPNEAEKHGIKISKDGVKRNGLELLKYKGVNFNNLKDIFGLGEFSSDVIEQIEIDNHYAGYYAKQEDDIEIFNKKAIYLYLRELTGLNTKQVVNNLNKIREKYKNFKCKWVKE